MDLVNVDEESLVQVFDAVSEEFLRANVNLKFEEQNSDHVMRLEFVSDENLFPTNDVGSITKFSLSGNTITSGIIYINNNFGFSGGTESVQYLGNSLAHELGHLFGLENTSLHPTTMEPLLRKYQYKLHSDDIHGLNYIFNNGTHTGEIYGKVIGGSEGKGVFGSHVLLIERSSSQVVQSLLTEYNGSFRFHNVDTSKEYFIYTTPFHYDLRFPRYYQLVRNDMCLGNLPYKGSFFASCQSSEKANPLLIEFAPGVDKINLYGVTARCQTESNAELNQSLLLSQANGTIENARRSLESYYFWSSVFYFHQGLFDEYEVAIDLTDLKFENGIQYKLEIGLVSQQLNSAGLFEITANLNDVDYEIGDEKKETINGEEYFTLNNYPNYDHLKQVPLLEEGNGTLRLRIKRYTVENKKNAGLWNDFSSEDFYGVNSLSSFDFAQIHLGVIKVDIFGQDTRPVRTNYFIPNNNRCPQGIYSLDIPNFIDEAPVEAAEISDSSDDLFSTVKNCGKSDAASGTSTGYLDLILLFLFNGISVAGLRLLFKNI